MLYFAYGSNLSASRLRSRVPGAEFVGVACLWGHEFRFHKRGRDGTAKADAFRSGPEAQVWGALAMMAASDLARLDEFEPGYQRTELPVEAKSGTERAWVYRAEPTAIGAGLRPYRWYLDLVVHGGRAHGLPSDYLDAVERTPAIEEDGSVQNTG